MSIVFLPVVIIQVVLHFIVLGLSLLLRAKTLEERTMSHLIALDQYANSLLGGHYLETISARMGRLLHTDRCVLCKYLCRFLDIFDKDHCSKAHKNTVEIAL